MRARTGAVVGFVVVAALALAVATGRADQGYPNSSPSTAISLPIGTPVTVPGPFEVQDTGTWLRLPTTVRTGDLLRLAVDNTNGQAGIGVTTQALFTAVPPTDDFGAIDTFHKYCCGPGVDVGTKNRIYVPYKPATSGQGFLVVSSWNVDGGTVTVTLEQILQKIVLGMAARAWVPQHFTLVANARYGDNTPVANGLAGILSWRVSGVPGTKFTTVARAKSAGGTFTFHGAFPKTAVGKQVQYRACATTPDGRIVCAATLHSHIR